MLTTDDGTKHPACKNPLQKPPDTTIADVAKNMKSMEHIVKQMDN